MQPFGILETALYVADLDAAEAFYGVSSRPGIASRAATGTSSSAAARACC